MDEKVPDTVKKCLDILDENMKILTDLEFVLDDEKEDEITTDLELHQLYDMAEDVAESEKIRRAESNLMWCQTEDSL